MPSLAEYIAIGETAMRLASSSPRSRKGVNIGGTASCTGCPLARSANHCSMPSSQVRSRRRRFSWLTRWLRVSSA